MQHATRGIAVCGNNIELKEEKKPTFRVDAP